MNVWNTIPFVRLLIAFLSGLLLAVNYSSLPQVPFYYFVVPFVLYYFSHKYFKNNYQYRFVIGFPIVLFFFLFGIKLVQVNTEIYYPNHFSKLIENNYVIRVNEPSVSKNSSLKFIGEVVQVQKGNDWVATKGKILIYLAKDSRALKIQYGDILLCNATTYETPAPKNPFEFDYKEYLAFHQIYHQSYINSTAWVSTNLNDANPILKLAYNTRNYFLKTISEHHISGDELAIGSALILGYEDELSNEVVSAFAATGALHVLSVSGLHVGIIFIVFNFLLKFMGESKTAKIVRFILLLAILWLYAILTGLSPSVWRASAMFSLITIGKFFKKETNTFNIIGCSAFILLCIKPFMITEVGFQLSYLAVIGIIALYKYFYKLFVFKNWLADNFWSITCVSIAAQLATFPLGLLYFHQFPNYFLFSNLVIIPLSTIILYGGVLLLVIAKIPIIGVVTAKILYFLLWTLKSTVELFEKLPFAVVEGVAITTFQTFLIYGLIIGIICLWQLKKSVFLKSSLVLSVLLSSLFIINQWQLNQQHKIVIYAINNSSAIDIIKGSDNVLLADSALLSNSDKIRFHLIPNWNNNGLRKVQKYVDTVTTIANTSFVKKQNHYLFCNNLTVLCTQADIKMFSDLKYKPDIVILNKRNKKRFRSLFYIFPEAEFICDGTISENFLALLIKQNPQLKLRGVSTEGAISINI